VQFDNIMAIAWQKVPFGIAQIGKAFRNEINPRNYTFRSREFEQMELEFFVKPGTDAQWHEYWVAERMKWYESVGLPAAGDRICIQGQCFLYCIGPAVKGTPQDDPRAVDACRLLPSLALASRPQCHSRLTRSRLRSAQAIAAQTHGSAQPRPPVPFSERRDRASGRRTAWPHWSPDWERRAHSTSTSGERTASTTPIPQREGKRRSHSVSRHACPAYSSLGVKRDTIYK
jgi:hypothetical protein